MSEAETPSSHEIREWIKEHEKTCLCLFRDESTGDIKVVATKEPLLERDRIQNETDGKQISLLCSTWFAKGYVADNMVPIIQKKYEKQKAFGRPEWFNLNQEQLDDLFSMMNSHTEESIKYAWEMTREVDVDDELLSQNRWSAFRNGLLASTICPITLIAFLAVGGSIKNHFLGWLLVCGGIGATCAAFTKTKYTESQLYGEDGKRIDWAFAQDLKAMGQIKVTDAGTPLSGEFPETIRAANTPEHLMKLGYDRKHFS